MGRLACRSFARLKEFGREYIPIRIVWHECAVGENPYADVLIR